MRKVLLINMPFATVKSPVIGISLLKARLKEEGITCDLKYFNIDFAQMVGYEIYEELSLSPPQMIGERLFAGEYFSGKLPDDQALKKYLKKVYQMPEEYVDKFLRLKKFIKPFLDYCLECIDWDDYDVIGFTSMFEQNMASISLAHRIKRLYPDKVIVFGGANCEEKMGIQLHCSFPFIDFVCSGEGEISFPRLLKRIFHHQPPTDIPGIIYRSKGKSVSNDGIQIVKEMNLLPYPDFDDYFLQLEQSIFDVNICSELPMETSRGCWWGEKFHCKFCGINEDSICFRSKDKERVMSEMNFLIDKYAKKYRIESIFTLDNIMDMKYFNSLLPELKEKRFPLPIFYEVKANLTREQLQLLREAGVTHVQPGIESLSTHILNKMSKGVKALQNLQFLKFCNQFSIHASWNILYGIPEEKSKDYRNTLEMISKILHLVPPQVVTPFILQRFSPYFNNPEKFGIMNVRPEKCYYYIYPFEEPDISNLAYFFDFDYNEEVKNTGYIDQLNRAVEYWRECYENQETLYSIKASPSVLFIEDNRSNAVASQLRLESAQKDIYEYCDRIRSFSSIYSYIRKKYNNQPVRERDIRDFLEDLEELKVMASEDDKYLSLAVSAGETPLMNG